MQKTPIIHAYILRIFSTNAPVRARKAPSGCVKKGNPVHKHNDNPYHLLIRKQVSGRMGRILLMTVIKAIMIKK